MAGAVRLDLRVNMSGSRRARRGQPTPPCRGPARAGSAFGHAVVEIRPALASREPPVLGVLVAGVPFRPRGAPPGCRTARLEARFIPARPRTDVTLIGRQ